MLRVLIGASFAALSLAISSGASADDDEKIAQCVSVYTTGGQTIEASKVFCDCMEDEMPDADENQAIVEWGKAHPDVATSCGTKAGFAAVAE